MIKIMSAVLTVVLSVAAVATVSAETKWQKEHPRRTQVNKRLKNQNKRINQGVKNGTLTKDEAKDLRSEDKQIRQQEREMAAQNGGHITKAEQKALNQELNQNSKKIYQEKHDGNTTTPPAGK